MLNCLAAAEFKFRESVTEGSVQVTQSDIWPPSLNSLKNHCPRSQTLLTVIHLFISPSFHSFFFFFLGSIQVLQLLLFVVLSVCLVSRHAC